MEEIKNIPSDKLQEVTKDKAKPDDLTNHPDDHIPGPGKVVTQENDALGESPLEKELKEVQIRLSEIRQKKEDKQAQYLKNTKGTPSEEIILLKEQLDYLSQEEKELGGRLLEISSVLEENKKQVGKSKRKEGAFITSKAEKKTVLESKRFTLSKMKFLFFFSYFILFGGIILLTLSVEILPKYKSLAELAVQFGVMGCGINGFASLFSENIKARNE